MAGTLTVDTIQSDSSYNSVLNIPSKVNFTGGMQIGGQDTTFGGMRNRIINGDMRIDQRNSGNIAYANTSLSNGGYFIDRWNANMSSDATISIQQSSDVPAGFSKSLKLAVTVADTSIGSSQYVQLFQQIEGYNIADLGWGTSSAVSVTVSFWVKSSIAGQYPVRLVNGDGTKSYAFYITINQADTWEYKTKVVPGPTSGTFNSTNGAGIALGFTFAAGTFFGGATENVWNTCVNYQNSHMTPAVNWIGTVGNTFYITGVQFEKGSSASSFEYRPYGTELQLCQRYYQRYVGDTWAGISSGVIYSANQYLGSFVMPVRMRYGPTMTYSALSDFVLVSGSVAPTPTVFAIDAASQTSVRFNCSATSLTIGHGCYIQMQSTSAWLAFQAEI